MSATPEDEAGALLNVDLDDALALYVRERARLVERLQQLSEADWLRTAEHPEFSHYSVWIMFRQLLLHGDAARLPNRRATTEENLGVNLAPRMECGRLAAAFRSSCETPALTRIVCASHFPL